MIAQPTSPTPPAATSGVEQELQLLRTRLDDALSRIDSLEQRLPIAERRLVARDSPEMVHALQLCAEIFPGCTTEIEVLCDPSEPELPWYSVLVHWKGEVRDSVDRQLHWHEKLTATFPHILDEFRIFVDLQ
jgi:hypothetical protein